MRAQVATSPKTSPVVRCYGGTRLPITLITYDMRTWEVLLPTGIGGQGYSLFPVRRPHAPMKRAVRVIIAVALGVLATIAVAWGSALLIDPVSDSAIPDIESTRTSTHALEATRYRGTGRRPLEYGN